MPSGRRRSSITNDHDGPAVNWDVLPIIVIEPVPLSEREKRILDEIEKDLYSEDPRFARDIRHPWWQKIRQVKLGGGLFVAGLLLLIGFFVSGGVVVVGVLAFGSMVAGIVLMSGATHDIARDQLRMHKLTMGDRLRESVRTRASSLEKKLRDRYKKGP